MIIKTAPLSVKNVSIFGALFKAQLPDTLNAIRQVIPDWMAVHVSMAQAGRNAPTKEQITQELLTNLKPMAMLYDPIYTLTNPEIPANTIATFVPDRVKPTFLPEYEGWKYIYYQDARELLKGLFDAALGGIPEGSVAVGDALIKGKIQGQAVQEGWTGSLSLPAFNRTMEAIVKPENPVMFWDTAFGFETTGEKFLKMSQFLLGAFGAKEDRLYFDATDFSWFLVVGQGGQLRVAMIG